MHGRIYAPRRTSHRTNSLTPCQRCVAPVAVVRRGAKRATHLCCERRLKSLLMARGRVFSEEDLDSYWRGGDWTQPVWFLSENDLLERAGFPIHLRRRAETELRWLYPPSVCRRLLGAGTGSVVGPLFNLTGLQICPLLQVGLDLEVVGRTIGPNLRADLRSSREFRAAATELSVWANLKRAGFDVGRVATASGKSPDFHFVHDYRLYRLEVKSLPPSDYEQFKFDLSLALQHELLPIQSQGRLCVLKPTTAWSRISRSCDPTSIRARLPELVREIREAVAFVQSRGLAPASYSAGRFVSLEVTRSLDGTALVHEELLVPESKEVRAKRALRLVRAAADQLRAGIGVVVIDVGEEVDASTVREELIGKQQGHPVRFSSCDAVIVRGIGMNRFQEPEQYAEVIVLSRGSRDVYARVADAVRWRLYRNPYMGRRGSRLLV